MCRYDLATSKFSARLASCSRDKASPLVIHKPGIRIMSQRNSETTLLLKNGHGEESEREEVWCTLLTPYDK